jgi:UDP-N-acetylmuramoylalanine--D-glutamate ligase
MEIENKNITIIGAIRSGLGAAKLIKKLGGIPFVSDFSDNEFVRSNVETLKEYGIAYEFGGHSDKVYECDLMVVSPGVPLTSDVIVKAKEKNIKLISEIELAYNFCKGKIIAITGTNGKTTTTSLIAHIINSCGMKAYEAGNIGNAFSEIALDVKENEFVALEISSFQIDLIDKFKPNAALILNITPDHLNRYNYDFQTYINSKLNIYRNQDSQDYLILNQSDPVLMKQAFNNKSRSLYFSLSGEMETGCFYNEGQIILNNKGVEIFNFPVKDLHIKGEHNILNTMSALCAVFPYLADKKEDVYNALRTFMPVEHRLEPVREIDGVLFINDSKATNVDSVWYALRSFDQPLFLILGGQDKGNDYEKIKDLVVDKVKKIYAIGSSAEKVFNFFHKLVKVEVKKTLEEAVISANNEARENDVVLLSPACKSFDQFNSYEHRGRAFKEAVNKL